LIPAVPRIHPNSEALLAQIESKRNVVASLCSNLARFLEGLAPKGVYVEMAGRLTDSLYAFIMFEDEIRATALLSWSKEPQQPWATPEKLMEAQTSLERVVQQRDALQEAAKMFPGGDLLVAVVLPGIEQQVSNCQQYLKSIQDELEKEAALVVVPQPA
jgi:hypothetical protein